MDEIDGTGISFTNYLSWHTDRENLQLYRTFLQAIVESQQLRRETETVGPSAELAYWRRLFTRFSSIINHLKSPYTQSFIKLLTEARSKLIKVKNVIFDHLNVLYYAQTDTYRQKKKKIGEIK